MKKNLFNVDYYFVKTSLALMTAGLVLFGCQKSGEDKKDLRNFKQVNLVANKSKYNPVTVDPTLQNAFGLAWSPNGVAWVNSLAGHVSEVYSAEGAIARPPVNIPSPTDSLGGGLPTGIVFSGDKGFNLSNGPSAFLFTRFDGVLSGWNGPSVNNAKRLRHPQTASYAGLAIAVSNGRNFIYGANFGAGKIDVWDTAFTLVNMPFKDPTIPQGYSPYNIQAADDFLFVMYARISASGLPVSGAGEGFVSVFKTDGSFVKRFASRGTLNVPWGLTVAPASFLDGKDVKNENGHGNAGMDDKSGNPKEPVILVGNFGDGRINVFSLDGKYLGQLQSHNHTIVIDGLWALSFAPSSATTVDPHRLYFTAGPEHETDGLYGYIIKD
jgi:uncharacterized protein (TIGR03118 family)